ncbi:hypothetical protein GOY07_01345 [Wolbachia endosymbiont of Litomosoides sigmodontis]|nr:hypothetical protein [Wolbachia endosymbiont of Litomosoides sigmodontis]QKX02867.1 hypothetical protein GOY07_01345 [Wolbachia endosymbiont of Litomosoides sigmodontis]
MNEYNANYLKKSIVENGSADEDWVIFMMKQIIKNLNIKYYHVAALTVELCHVYTKGSCFVCSFII